MVKVIEYSLGTLLGMTFVLMFMLCILTPEKDKYGDYTQPFKYWTSESYFEQHFGN